MKRIIIKGFYLLLFVICLRWHGVSTILQAQEEVTLKRYHLQEKAASTPRVYEISSTTTMNAELLPLGAWGRVQGDLTLTQSATVEESAVASDGDEQAQVKLRFPEFNIHIEGPIDYHDLDCGLQQTMVILNNEHQQIQIDGKPFRTLRWKKETASALLEEGMVYAQEDLGHLSLQIPGRSPLIPGFQVLQRQLSALADLTHPPLPTTPVVIGDRWEADVDFRLAGLPVKLPLRFTLVSVETVHGVPGCLKIEVSQVEEAKTPDLSNLLRDAGWLNHAVKCENVSISIESSGSLYFHPELGALISSEIRHSITGSFEMSLSMGGQTANVKVSGSSKCNNTVSLRLPRD